MTTRRLLPFLPVLLLLPACRTTGAPVPKDTVEALAAEYWEESLRDSPEMATFLGVEGYDDRLSDLSAAARDARRRDLAALLRRAARQKEVTLSAEDALTLSLLRTEIENELGAEVCRADLWEVSPLDGPQVDLLQLPAFQSVETPAAGAALLSRYQAMPEYIDQHIANLRQGLAEGYTAPRIAVERVLGQLEALAETPDSAFSLLDPIRERPAGWTEVEWREWTGELHAAVAEIRPAFGRYHRFLREAYLPHARSTVGVAANPRGAECYAALARAHTSLDLPPEEIHRIGLEEMARIQAEMKAITRRLFDSEDLPAIFRMLREDPRYTFDSREAAETFARDAVKRAEARLPDVFGMLPEAPVVVKRMEAFQEKDAPAAYYFAPAADGSRPGIYYVNTYQPEQRPRYTAEVLAFHEAVPGHHLQIALAQELEGIPEFRKHAGTTAFVEGWGLYSERLSDEMGLYSGDLDRLGMLSFDAWRAARLVVDAGMHALGWTREQAIDYLLQNVAITPVDAANEVDRYIVMPGQALAYKLGQREILALRREAEERLGSRFDIRAFHDVVLGAGAVTLPVLRERVERWITHEERA